MSHTPCSFAALLRSRMLSLSVVATSNESLFSGLQPMRSAYLRNEPVAYGELKISCET